MPAERALPAADIPKKSAPPAKPTGEKRIHDSTKRRRPRVRVRQAKLATPVPQAEREEVLKFYQQLGKSDDAGDVAGRDS
ncbi:hypothetical protein BH09PLA1_BH09PLA1_00270 [soil metagenome]